VLRAGVNEVNVQPVDLGDEVRHGVELRLDLAPVVLLLPVARDRLNGVERDALRLVLDGLLIRPARGRDPRTQRLELLLGDLDLGEGADRWGTYRFRGRDGH